MRSAPAVQKALDEGIPVIGYDRLIENPNAFYITFDNVEVGRMQAREVQKVKPKGNYIFIKGNSADPNADFVHGGQLEVLKAAMDAGDIKNVGEVLHRQLGPGQRPEGTRSSSSPPTTTMSMRSSRRMTARPAAPSRRWRRRVSPDRWRFPARTATRQR